MASSFVLTLDTHAPQLAWGAVGGTHAGELLQVAYIVNEPGVDSAVLSLPDGRVLAMAVQPDRLEVLLPADAPTGVATITAVTVDDVDNLADYTLDVHLVGGVGPTPLPTRSAPSAPMPTGPARRSRPEHKQLVSPRSSAIASSRALVRVDQQHATRVTTASRAGVARTPARGEPVTLVGRSAARVFTTSPTPDTKATLATSGGVVRRRDGQALEEALLLDLL